MANTLFDDFIDTILKDLENQMEKEIYEALTTSSSPEVEIFLAFDGDEFVHYGYYKNIDDAIESFEELKSNLSSTLPEAQEYMDEDGNIYYDTIK